jgi:hypothetical protein
LKEDKPYRVVLRNLHHSIPVEDIKEDLQKEGFKARNITNITHRVTKLPLPMFYVDLEPASNNKDIYNLRFLNNLVIKVDPPPPPQNYKYGAMHKMSTIQPYQSILQPSLQVCKMWQSS